MNDVIWRKEAAMLALSRITTESIMSGDNVVVTVLAVCGSRVRIGIDAPSSIPVHRLEVSARNIEPPNHPPPFIGDRP
jgi:carbon storage regulator